MLQNLALTVKGWKRILNFSLTNFMKLSICVQWKQLRRKLFLMLSLPFSVNERIAYCSMHVPLPHIILCVCCWFFFRLLSTIHIYVHNSSLKCAINEMMISWEYFSLFGYLLLFFVFMVMGCAWYKSRKHLVKNCLIYVSFKLAPTDDPSYLKCT